MSFSEWKEVKLSDITNKITKGTTPTTIGASFIESGINYIKSECITASRLLDRSKYVYISEETHEKLKRSQILVNDILFSMAGMFLGKTGIVFEQDIPANTNQAVAIIRVVTELADYKYIYYYLSQKIVQDYVNGSTSQSAQPNINLKQIGDINITIPPLPEQKAIADTLSCLDDKIELNNQINKTLEEMAQAIFKSWFVDFEPFQDGEFEDSELGRIPKRWKVVELSEIGRFVKGKKPKNLLDVKTSESEEQYLTIDVLNGGNPQFACIDKMVICNIYDVLMVMDGASSGTVYFGLKGIVGSTIAKFEVTHEQLREIVYQYLKINEAEVKAHNTGSAIPHTDKGYVSKCKIAVPDDENLKQIAMSLKKIRESIINNSNENQTLIVIRDTLLSKLMSGEIRVPIEEVK